MHIKVYLHTHTYIHIYTDIHINIIYIYIYIYIYLYIIYIAEFVLNNKIFEVNSSKAYQQKSDTAIETKFAPPYAWIYMDEVEQNAK